MIRQLPDVQELATARARLYQLLASVYARPPAPDFLKFLAGWAASQTEAEGSSPMLSEQMKHGLTTLDDFFKNLGERSWEQLGQAASIEFTRLFRGVTQHYSPPPPYESVYREEGGRVFGELTVDVHQEYRRFGFDLTTGLENEPPDHISFELEFMHLLCRQEAEAWERDDEDEALRLCHAERDFLTEHLLAWLPGFCNVVREHDQLRLFSPLADLTEGWVNFDYQQHLQEIE